MDTLKGSVRLAMPADPGSISIVRAVVASVASKLATAMEARGFGSGIPRTWSRPSRLHARDAVALLGGIVIMALAITAAVAAGSFRFVWS